MLALAMNDPTPDPEEYQSLRAGPDPDPEVEAELQMESAIAAESGRTPERISPEQGVRLMTGRVAYLREQAQRALENDMIDHAKYVQRDLNEALARLAEYEAQLKGRN